MFRSSDEGSDAGQEWFLAMILIVALPALVLLVLRWAGVGSRTRLGAAR